MPIFSIFLVLCFRVLTFPLFCSCPVVSPLMCWNTSYPVLYKWQSFAHSLSKTLPFLLLFAVALWSPLLCVEIHKLPCALQMAEFCSLFEQNSAFFIASVLQYNDHSPCAWYLIHIYHAENAWFFDHNELLAVQQSHTKCMIIKKRKDFSLISSVWRSISVCLSNYWDATRH